jgi:uncharacterized membrane protein YecN with MAPEG domain
MSNVPSEFIKAHAKVMLGYTSVFTCAVLLQLYMKVNSIKQFKQMKKKLAAEGKDVSELQYNRYSDTALMVADRIVGNFNEWAPSFIVLFGTNVALGNDVVTLGWSYVALRFMYPILALSGGLNTTGARPLIFAATMPMYGVLTLLGMKIGSVVF